MYKNWESRLDAILALRKFGISIERACHQQGVAYGTYWYWQKKRGKLGAKTGRVSNGRNARQGSDRVVKKKVGKAANAA
jgi:hypothetical protein